MLGHLFKTTSKSQDTREILFFITARILDTPGIMGTAGVQMTGSAEEMGSAEESGSAPAQD